MRRDVGGASRSSRPARSARRLKLNLELHALLCMLMPWLLSEASVVMLHVPVIGDPPSYVIV
jgi:hypothetical protein